MNQQNIPQKFLCPLTKHIIKDPVIISDGITYERGSIEDWLLENQNSPVTNQPLQQQENFQFLTSNQKNKFKHGFPQIHNLIKPKITFPLHLHIIHLQTIHQCIISRHQHLDTPYGQPPYGHNSEQPTQIIIQTKTVTNNNYQNQQSQNQQIAEDACCAVLACLAVLEFFCIILRCLRR